MDMTPALAFIDGALDRLRRNGYTDAQGPPPRGAPPTERAMRRTDFRVRWGFTQLRTYVVLRDATNGGDPEIAIFWRGARQWVSHHKGDWPFALQSGVAVIPVAVTGTATPMAIAEACRRPEMDFGTMVLPMLVETDHRRAHSYSGTMVWGLIYQKFLRDQQKVVVG